MNCIKDEFPLGEQPIASQQVDAHEVNTVTEPFIQSSMFQPLHNREFWYQAV